MRMSFWSSDVGSSDLLPGVNLGGAMLDYTVFTASDLAEARLAMADLSFADLRRANLRDADMRGIKLHRANLTDANLSGVDFSAIERGGASGPGWVANLEHTIGRASGRERGYQYG